MPAFQRRRREEATNRRWWPHGFGAEAGRIPGGGASPTTRRRGRRFRRGGGATASSASASCHGRRTLEGQLDPGRHVFVELFQGTSSMDRAGGDAKPIDRNSRSCSSPRVCGRRASHSSGDAGGGI